jgi:hypothetical protein
MHTLSKILPVKIGVLQDLLLLESSKNLYDFSCNG